MEKSGEETSGGWWVLLLVALVVLAGAKLAFGLAWVTVKWVAIGAGVLWAVRAVRRRLTR